MKRKLTEQQLQTLSQSLGVKFKDPKGLELAMTHRSFSRVNNERLEFLGDAILSYVVSAWLYKHTPKKAEGELTRLRATLVRKETLAEIAREFDLSKYVVLGVGERKSGGYQRDSILADALEAIIGALFLDSGIEVCEKTLLSWFKERLQEASKNVGKKDPKTVLQEYLQARKQSLPVYEVLDETGQAHDLTFNVACKVKALEKPIVASGKSRRKAEQSSAEKALLILKKQNEKEI